jgi:hypothetical protein
VAAATVSGDGNWGRRAGYYLNYKVHMAVVKRALTWCVGEVHGHVGVVTRRVEEKLVKGPSPRVPVGEKSCDGVACHAQW